MTILARKIDYKNLHVGFEALVTENGGEFHYAMWDTDEYDEMRGYHRACWNYGSAEIDPSNFHPTHYIDIPEVKLECEDDKTTEA